MTRAHRRQNKRCQWKGATTKREQTKNSDLGKVEADIEGGERDEGKGVGRAG